MITQARLKELVTYDPETGLFTRNQAWGTLPAGRVTGKQDGNYVQIKLDGVRYTAHRLAWLYMTGEWPSNGQVDHDDRNPGNNKWDNLKDVTNQLNHRNKGLQSNNTSGCKGVCLNKRTGKYVATIKNAGKVTYLGCYDTLDQAIVARRNGERAIWGSEYE